MTEKKRLSDMRATAWSVTMWMTDETGYTPDTINIFTQNMPNEWAIEGQMEKGKDSGDLHYQLLLKTPQTRGTRVAKFFPKCHIEDAQKFHALQTYVHKEDTRVGEFKTVENRSPQWSVVRLTFFKWLIKEEPSIGFFGHTDDERMRLWDKFIGLSIREGMMVDVIGVNPQYRSCIQRYWLDYIHVEQTTAPVDNLDRQTESQEVSIPMLSPPPPPPPPPPPGGGTKKTRNS